MLYRFPYFLDEGILASWARIGLDPDQRLQSLTQGIRPGLVWMTMAGMKLGQDPLPSIRLSTAAFGLVILVAGTLLAFRFGGTATAAAYAALALVSPFALLYDIVGGRDTVIAGLAVAALLLQVELARRPALWVGLLLGVTFGLDVLVKESGRAAMLLLPLSLVFFHWHAPGLRRRLLAWSGCVALAYLMAAAATFPMRLSLAYENLDETQTAYGVIRSFSEIRAQPLVIFEQQWPVVRGALGGYLTAPLLLLLAIGIGLGLRQRPRFTAVLLIWAAAPLASVIWVAKAAAYPRYLAPAMPMLLLLTAYGAAQTGLWLWSLLAGRRWRAPALAALAALALLPALAFDARLAFSPRTAPYPTYDRGQYAESYTSGLGLEQVARGLRLIAAGGSLVVGLDANSHPALPLLLLHDPGITLVPFAEAQQNPSIRLVVLNSPKPPTEFGPLRPVYVYHRPYGGTPIGIYERTG